MRRPVRPFIIEYKSRSKSSAFHSPSIGSADELGQTLSFSDFESFAPSSTHLKNGSRTILEGAEALFGEASTKNPLREEQATRPLAREDRVLPSLIDDALATRSRKDVEEVRQTRKTPRVRKPSSTRNEKQQLRFEQTTEKVTAAEPIEEIFLCRRERSSIQKRWVLRTELKPGEKWKRRLCKAAR